MEYVNYLNLYYLIFLFDWQTNNRFTFHHITHFIVLPSILYIIHTQIPQIHINIPQKYICIICLLQSYAY